MIAVDAGAHLASIVRILERYLPSSSDKLPPDDYEIVLDDGPFAGLRLPNITAKANAVHIFRELIHSFLITHPHLDHLSGLAINTPGLEYGREAKAIVSLPSSIDAIKQHIFNDIIWPNLSDEGDGAGFVTYRRLIEGGNPRLGSGDCRGYVNVCEGLATKCWSVSHGKCALKNSSHQHGNSLGVGGEQFAFPARRISRVSDNDGYMNLPGPQQGHRDSSAPPMTPNRQLSGEHPSVVAVESSAFIIRNESKGAEIIVFGDIEPDSISINPRNHIVWDDIAPKVACGALRAIFIECSYDDSVRDEDLYGHLCPRHLIAELLYLAQSVAFSKSNSSTRRGAESPGLLRRKRKIDEATSPPNAQRHPSASEHKNGIHHHQGTDSASPSSRAQHSPRISPVFAPDASQAFDLAVDRHDAKEPTAALDHDGGPLLAGVTVHIIHVKDTLMDGPPPGDTILEQLEEQGCAAGLGCMFSITQWSQSIWI